MWERVSWDWRLTKQSFGPGKELVSLMAYATEVPLRAGQKPTSLVRKQSVESGGGRIKLDLSVDGLCGYENFPTGWGALGQTLG